MKTFKEYFLTEDPTMWPWMWKDNKGEFWRGQGKEGKGSGLGALGAGIYFTWDENMAKANAKKFGGKVSKCKIKKGIHTVQIFINQIVKNWNIFFNNLFFNSRIF